MAPRPRRKKKRQIKYFRILIALIILGGLIFAFLNSSLFGINKIVVEGNSKLESEELINRSDIRLGDNLFFFKKKRAINNLSANPFIENVEISRTFPKGIKIKVKEREGYAITQLPNSYLIIDRFGYFIDESNTLLLNLKVIKGLKNTENIKLGETIFEYASEEQNKLLTELFDGEERLPFKSLTLEEDECEMTLNGDVFVGFGSYNDIDYKFEVLNKMITKIELDTTRNASTILLEEWETPTLIYE